MAAKAVFYDAGCSVAQQRFAAVFDPQRYNVEIARLGVEMDCLDEAKFASVTSDPAFVIDGALFITSNMALTTLL